MNTKPYNCFCLLATLYFSGTRAQAFHHSLDTDVFIEKKKGVSKEERLKQLGEITLVDDNYLEGYTYTLTMEDKKKVFSFYDTTDKGQVVVNVNELAFIIAAFYWRNNLYIQFHEFNYLTLERLRIENNIVKYNIGS